MRRIDAVRIAGVYANTDPPEAIENNVWVIGDDHEVLVVDASHDVTPILTTIDGRRVTQIVCTHGHWDHVNRALALQGAVDAPVALHPADRMLWDELHASPPDLALAADDLLLIGGLELKVLHTPGHTPGSVCLYDQGGTLFSGDTLFEGGPGTTAIRFGDFEVIIRSISEQLLVLPGETAVHTGHGPSTTIGAEAPHLPAWIRRGW
jgi:glyoxylase-like metal-dependent hydrolase (beta-lactamase superfamily II)